MMPRSQMMLIEKSGESEWRCWPPSPLGGALPSDAWEREKEMQKPRETLGGLEPRPSLGRASAMAAKFEQLMAEAHSSDNRQPS